MFIAICSTKIKVKQNKIPRSTAVKLASLFEGRKNHRNINLYLVFFLVIGSAITAGQIKASLRVRLCPKLSQGSFG